MNIETLILALKGRRLGATIMAKCPAHRDHDPSLSIVQSSGRVLVYCHAGCGQAKVIAALRGLGLWNDDGPNYNQLRSAEESRTGRPDRSIAALKIWQLAKPGCSTPVDTYLLSRGLTIQPPQSLRFHAGLTHPSGEKWPAMIALVTRGSEDVPVAIHRTFLTREGTGKAPVIPQKMMLGPCRGGAVRLAPPNNMLMVGEGIETCLAAMQATGQPAWAALSTSGLRSLHLPYQVRNVIVLADGDEPGEAAAQACGLRWKREGRQVRIARPPRGADFNDLLFGGVDCDRRAQTINGVTQQLVFEAIAKAEEIRAIPVRGGFERAKKTRERFALATQGAQVADPTDLIPHNADGIKKARCRECGRLHDVESSAFKSLICTPCLKAIVIAAILRDGGKRPKWA